MAPEKKLLQFEVTPEEHEMFLKNKKERGFKHNREYALFLIENDDEELQQQQLDKYLNPVLNDMQDIKQSLEVIKQFAVDSDISVKVLLSLTSLGVALLRDDNYQTTNKSIAYVKKFIDNKQKKLMDSE